MSDHPPMPSTASDTAPTGTYGRLEVLVAMVLRVGVLLSCAAIVIGTAVTLFSARTRAAAASALPGLRAGALHPKGWPSYRSISSVFGAIGQRPGPAIVMLGVLVLVATPVMRVAVSVAVFAVEHDRKYVVMTAVVLAVLVASFALG